MVIYVFSLSRFEIVLNWRHLDLTTLGKIISHYLNNKVVGVLGKGLTKNFLIDVLNTSVPVLGVLVVVPIVEVHAALVELRDIHLIPFLDSSIQLLHG
jgi:hypothetical protein